MTSDTITIQNWIALLVVGIAFGGSFLLRILSGGHEANALQKTFFRAGHAHAGVLVTLGLVLAVLGAMSGASPGWAGAGAIVALLAAIVIPLGIWSGACGATRKHFTSVLGVDPQRPNRMIASVWVRAVCLVVGLTMSGVSVLVAGVGGLD